LPRGAVNGDAPIVIGVSSGAPLDVENSKWRDTVADIRLTDAARNVSVSVQISGVNPL
jgi:hypothetical protein